MLSSTPARQARSSRCQREHADPWGSLHYRCGRLVTVRGAEAGISRAEGSLEHAVQRRIVMNPTGLHALAVTRDGMPVRSWVLPGNTADVATLARIKQDLHAW